MAEHSERHVFRRVLVLMGLFLALLGRGALGLLKGCSRIGTFPLRLLRALRRRFMDKLYHYMAFPVF